MKTRFGATPLKVLENNSQISRIKNEKAKIEMELRDDRNLLKLK